MNGCVVVAVLMVVTSKNTQFNARDYMICPNQIDKSIYATLHFLIIHLHTHTHTHTQLSASFGHENMNNVLCLWYCLAHIKRTAQTFSISNPVIYIMTDCVPTMDV